jgi:exo-1,4-beta-D-glucosaminidase
LLLEDSNGQLVSSNFYWLSTKDDVLDWQKSTWYYTPTNSYADMTQLQRLQPVKLALSSRAVRKDGDEIARVTVSNPSRSMAFFIHLQIKDGRTERDVLPVIWQDNYFSLLPGERREVTATYQVRDLGKAGAVVAVDGWNISPVKTPIIANWKP